MKIMYLLLFLLLPTLGYSQEGACYYASYSNADYIVGGKLFIFTFCESEDFTELAKSFNLPIDNIKEGELART